SRELAGAAGRDRKAFAGDSRRPAAGQRRPARTFMNSVDVSSEVPNRAMRQGDATSPVVVRLSVFGLIRSDVKRKAIWLYESDRPRMVVKVLFTDGTAAMIL